METTVFHALCDHVIASGHADRIFKSTAVVIVRLPDSHVSMVPGMAMGYLVAAPSGLPYAAPFSAALHSVLFVVGHAAFLFGNAVLLALGPRNITSAEVGLLILLKPTLAPMRAWAILEKSPSAMLFSAAAS